MIASAIVATVLASSVLGLSSPADSTVADSVYPGVVRDGLSYSHASVPDQTLRGVGHSVCAQLDSGMSKMDVARSMMSTFDQADPMDPLAPREAGYMIGASTAAYCPEHTDDPVA